MNKLGKQGEAESAFRRALALQEKLAASFPCDPRLPPDPGQQHT